MHIGLHTKAVEGKFAKRKKIKYLKVSLNPGDSLVPFLEYVVYSKNFWLQKCSRIKILCKDVTFLKLEAVANGQSFKCEDFYSTHFQALGEGKCTSPNPKCSEITQTFHEITPSFFEQDEHELLLFGKPIRTDTAEKKPSEFHHHDYYSFQGRMTTLLLGSLPEEKARTGIYQSAHGIPHTPITRLGSLNWLYLIVLWVNGGPTNHDNLSQILSIFSAQITLPFCSE